MLRKCYLVVSDKGESVFLELSRAIEYATKWHGQLVRMYGQDNSPLSSIDIPVLEEVIDVPI